MLRFPSTQGFLNTQSTDWPVLDQRCQVFFSFLATGFAGLLVMVSWDMIKEIGGMYNLTALVEYRPVCTLCIQKSLRRWKSQHVGSPYFIMSQDTMTSSPAKPVAKKEKKEKKEKSEKVVGDVDEQSVTETKEVQVRYHQLWLSQLPWPGGQNRLRYIMSSNTYSSLGLFARTSFLLGLGHGLLVDISDHLFALL
jgi:hypothetical protein